MVIGVDVDGVLRNFVKALEEQYLLDFGEPSLPVTEWELHPFFPALGKDVYKYAFETNAPTVFLAADAFKGASEFTHDLSDEGQNHIVIVTSQPKPAIRFTERWLRRNNIYFDSLVFTYNKGLFHVDVLLDDGVHNLVDASKRGIRAVCFNQPWNQGWTGERVHSYEQFKELINAKA